MNNPNPVVYNLEEREADGITDPLIVEVFDLIRDIKDPEHPHTLEELNVINENSISIEYKSIAGSTENTSTSATKTDSSPQACVEDNDMVWIKIVFTPTVPHCSLATLIGLCLRVKLERCLQHNYKLDIYVSEGTHSIEEDVNKQINDKERVAAAMENPDLRDMVELCIKEVEY